MFLVGFLIWVLYSLIEGFREGYYWHYKNLGDDGNSFEIHPIFSFQRGLVLVLIGLLSVNMPIVFLSIPLLKSVIFIISLMLVFSFIHNGVYYWTRNRLDKNIYKLKWRDYSNTSTAKWTKILSFRNRTVMFVMGLIGVLLIIVL